MRILNENVSRNIMNALRESANKKWEIPNNLKVVNIIRTNDPHGTCMGKFNDGTWFVAGNGEIGIYDTDPSDAYGFSDKEYDVDNADETVENFNKEHLLAGFEADSYKDRYEDTDYDRLRKLIYGE